MLSFEDFERAKKVKITHKTIISKVEPEEEPKKDNIKDIDQLLSYINESTKKSKKKRNKKNKKTNSGNNPGTTEQKSSSVSLGTTNEMANNKIHINDKDKEIIFEKFKAMIKGDSIHKNNIHKIRPTYPKEWIKYIESL